MSADWLSKLKTNLLIWEFVLKANLSSHRFVSLRRINQIKANNRAKTNNKDGRATGDFSEFTVEFPCSLKWPPQRWPLILAGEMNFHFKISVFISRLVCLRTAGDILCPHMHYEWEACYTESLRSGLKCRLRTTSLIRTFQSPRGHDECFAWKTTSSFPLPFFLPSHRYLLRHRIKKDIYVILFFLHFLLWANGVWIKLYLFLVSGHKHSWFDVQFRGLWRLIYCLNNHRHSVGFAAFQKFWLKLYYWILFQNFALLLHCPFLLESVRRW